MREEGPPCWSTAGRWSLEAYATMSESTTAERNGSVTTDESDDDHDCDCDGLPEGVPCFSCYLDGVEFDTGEA